MPALSEAVPGWDAASLTDCDPYLVWADASTHAIEVKETQPARVCVLVELRPRVDQETFIRWINAGHSDRFIPNRDQSLTLPFLSGLVNSDGLARLITDAAGRKSHVLRFTLQESRRRFVHAVDENHKILKAAEILWSTQAATSRSPKIAGHAVTPVDSNGQDPSSTPGVFLGIFDDGLPALWARDLLARKHGTAVYLWDQSWWPRHAPQPPGGMSQRAGPWPFWKSARWESGTTNDPGFRYGRRLAATTATASEAELYLSMRYHYPAPRHTHGAAVLGLMVPTLVPRPAGCGQRPALPDHVSGLAMVQLLGRSVEDTSGGSLAARVLDALQYILWQEAHHRDFRGDPRPTVVNLSYAVHAGPHDGSSLFERALAGLLDAHPHLHVALAAGNGHLSGGHWRATVPPDRPATASVQVLPDNPADTFVEIWLPGDASAVTITVTPPGGGAPITVTHGQAFRRVDPVYGVDCALIYPPRVAQSNGPKTMVLLAIGATRASRADGTLLGLNGRPRAAVQASAGRWHITVENRGQAPLPVDAWIERGDAAPDHAGGSRQAYFPDSAATPSGNTQPEQTLSGLATGHHDRLKVIGAARADGVHLADYSAAGSDAQPPDALAVADWSAALPGVRSGGFLGGTVTRINGTSAASAVYARAWALALAGTPPAAVPVAPLPPPRPDPLPRPEWPPMAGETARGSANMAATGASDDFRVGFYP